jgi:hypothetical protein
VTIILLTNSDDVFINSAIRDLAAIVFGEKYNLPKERVSVPQDAKTYDAYLGRYQLDTDLILNVAREGNRLMGQVDGRKFELLPKAKQSFL